MGRTTDELYTGKKATMENTKKIAHKPPGYLRKAESCMFSDKNQDALRLLNNARKIIRQTAPQLSIRSGGYRDFLSVIEPDSEYIRESLLAKDSGIQPVKEMHIQVHLLEKEVAEEEAGTASEQKLKTEILKQNVALCLFWESEFRRVPYFDGTALKVAKLLEEKKHYQKAKEMVSRYSKTEFFAPITSDLEFMSKDLMQRMHTFEFFMVSTASFLIKKIEKSIQEKIYKLTHNTAWVFQPQQKPQFIGKQEVGYLSQQIEEFSLLLGANVAPMKNLKHIFELLLQVNAARMEERCEAEEAICAAKSTLFCHCYRAVIIRAAMVKAWKTKHTGGQSDYTKMQCRAKSTREAIVEIAARINGCEDGLFTFRVSKEIRTDGTFGKTMSNLMFS